MQKYINIRMTKVKDFAKYPLLLEVIIFNIGNAIDKSEDNSLLNIMGKSISSCFVWAHAAKYPGQLFWSKLAEGSEKNIREASYIYPELFVIKDELKEGNNGLWNRRG